MTVQVPGWSQLELDVMRIGLGFVVIWTISKRGLFRPDGSPSHPVGLARAFDLAWMASRRSLRFIQHSAYLAALLYASDRIVPFALLALSGAILLEVTFEASYGAVNHGHHLLAAVLVAQTAAVALWNAADHWDWDLGRLLAGSQGSTAAWWAVQAVLAVYFTSGVTKLINTAGAWIYRSTGLLLSARARVETDRLMGKESWGGSNRSAAFVTWLFERPWAARVTFGAGLLMELVAPLGVLGETALLLVGLGLLALHVANGQLLNIQFRGYEMLVFIYLVNVPRLGR